MKSRRFTAIDVPEPSAVTTEFIYNFFVNDEKVNDSGDSRAIEEDNIKLQKSVDKDSLRFQIPRYVEVSFPQVTSFGDQFGDSKDQLFQNAIDISKVNSEETVTNVGFSALREADDDCIPRMKEKFDALSKAMGLKFQDTDQSKKLAETMQISQDDVQSIISPLNDDKFLVNSRKNAAPKSPFQIAGLAKLTSQLNKRLMAAAINSADDTSPLSKLEVVEMADRVTSDFLSSAHQFSITEGDIEPQLQPTELSETDEKKKLLGASAVGYLLTRSRIGDDGKKQQTRTFFLPGPGNTKYIDTEVLYGTTYMYDVRAVYRIDAIVDGKSQSDTGSGKRNHRISFLVASRPSPYSRVKTEEFQPPAEPDGVFYNFNYDEERGLVVKWQIPSGRSRDTKYFQVFRRKTIFQPFVCIAQVDFDDSAIRTLLPEQVSLERIFAFPGVRTFFEDKEFTRNDSFIYAVAAVDAHGLSSGYSAQTRVGFDKIKNVLTLKSISRGGAPKQYPNFYVDPDLDDNITVDSFTQDAIFDSGHRKVTVYFTPDARTLSSADGNTEEVFYTDNQQGTYSFHFINLDLQKSDSVTLDILDLRKLK